MERSLPKGILIAVEGIDGSGKSSLVTTLSKRLRAIGNQVVATCEPTRGPFGMELRRSESTARHTPERELALYIADRREHLANCILPSLDERKIVITDRYYFSTAAYQGARGFDPDDLIAQNEAFAPVPDLLLLLDLPIDVALERIERGRGERPNTFERAEMLAKSREIFLSLCEDRSFAHVVDANREMPEIADEIIDIISAEFEWVTA